MVTFIRGEKEEGRRQEEKLDFSEYTLYYVFDFETI